jgi:vacuolar-type H+-ATPase subunit E/Vma4
MESLEKGKQELLSGIEADIRAEKQQIIDDVRKQIAEKKMYAEKKIESILNDARKQAQEKAEALKRKINSSVGLEIKRLRLKVRNEVVKEIIDRVEKKIETKMAEDNYRTFLAEWIIEAAVGLGAESATINASQQERQLIDQQLISDVKEKLQALTGSQVELVLSQSQPLKDQGVVLVSADGRTAYNNQVKTRIMRTERTIRNLLNDNLFNED